MSAPERPHDEGGTDMLIAVAIVVVGAAAAVHWLAANLAALIGRGRLAHAGIAATVTATVHVPGHWADPKQAWPPDVAANLPGPVVYWASALTVIVPLVTGVVMVTGRVGRHRSERVDRRRRVGVGAQAALASTTHLRPLLTRRPQPGRFVLARWGSRYLSTEAPTYGRRRGVQGAVAVFGPSQSGKTTGLITGAAEWEGPGIISSVKTDLLHATLAARRAAGEVKVFDPLGVSGLPTAQWTPLAAATHLPGALAAAQLLARAGGDDGPGDRFWRGQAEQLIAAMLFTAANTAGHTMTNVVRWVLELDRPAEGGSGTLAPLVRLLTDSADPNVALAAKQVQGWLHGQWATDPRTTSSVYATARNAIWPWADPAVAASAQGCDITLEWLTQANNTLYLCAPLGDETRIGIVFAVILHDLITQAFDHYNRAGQPLSPKLLVLIDEAANTPLPKLPQWASTVTGAGIQLVTVWQSKAQLDELYHHHADTVLNNHRTKLIYPSGLTDTATTTYLSDLAGHEHIRSDLDQHNWAGPQQRSPTAPSTAVPLLTPNILRQMQTGDALLLHGNLPPAWIRGRQRR